MEELAAGEYAFIGVSSERFGCRENELAISNE
jgi:hypothetical protein